MTGLRNPCAQLDKVQKGLMAATLDRDDEGRLVRKAGIMAIVIATGAVRPGDVVMVKGSNGSRAGLIAKALSTAQPQAQTPGGQTRGAD